ncbi:TetR/AcrR family transcriptional regulator [Beijerinckia sp. L45]|uniref:TetR/AcrR family transcriptional regulator n=1 Tax=Beijerinckia sp. L45 TaxID=1641855 RepID=UPI0034CF8C34
MSVAKSAKRSYLSAAVREKAIVEAATAFFAEHGFEGQTRELAKTMGITHSAIFRYFPTKEALIDRVYEHVYLSRWNPTWNDLIVDRSMSLEARLTRFYIEYAERIFHYDWVRIFVFAGMRSVGITDRYLKVLRDNLIMPVCRELRSTGSREPEGSDAPSVADEEAVWGLHGQVFYMAIREFIYNQTIPEDRNSVISNHVRIFMAGIRA